MFRNVDQVKTTVKAYVMIKEPLCIKKLANVFGNVRLCIDRII